MYNNNMGDFSGFEVTDSEKFGRFVLAKRDYRRGDLVLDEEPLLIAPFSNQAISSGDENLLEESSRSAWECVGCFNILFPQDIQFCPKCQWPVCCNSCAQESLHAKYECSLFEENKIGVSTEMYSRIYLLRAVLMFKDQENPALWGKLSSLSWTSSLSPEGCLTKSAEDIQDLTQFLSKCFQINVDPKIVAQITGAWKINVFGSLEAIEKDCFYRAEALYRVGSMFAHSCAPNAEWIILPKDCNGIKKWNLRVYTRRNIRCGEAINISYIPDCFKPDTAARRRILSTHLGFDCKCDRCCDPTEFFFYTEAVKCPCGNETLTADVPSDEFSSWTCNSCRVSRPSTFAKTCVEKFRAWAELKGKLPSQTSSDMLLPTAVKYGLSPNHRELILSMFLWMKAENTRQIEKLRQHSMHSEEIFKKLMTSAAKCVKTFRMFGLLSDIVELESCFAGAIATFYFKAENFFSIQYDPYLPAEKKQIIIAICAHLEIAVDIMNSNPYNLSYSFFRQHLIDGFNFWKNELHALKDVIGVGTSHCLDEVSGSGVQVIDNVSEPELKNSPNEFNNPVSKDSGEEASSEVLKKPVEMEQVAEGQSAGLSPYDVIASSCDSNSTFLKPSLSILTEFDFYFDA